MAGGLAGGATRATLERLTRYGERIGLAFQLIDDVHDQDGLAQALGSEAASAEARRLLCRAAEALEPLGKRAETLRQLADWLGGTV